MVAAAIIGSAVVGGVVTTMGASRASGAAEAGAEAAAAATIESTMLQIQEISRQFDYQQQLLAPFVANQYAAQSAYQDLLGIGGGAQARPAGPGPSGPGAQPQPPGYGEYGDFFRGPQGADYRTGPEARLQVGGAGPQDVLQQPPGGPQVPAYPGPGATQFTRGPGGEFIDPNLDPTRLADINTLPGQVRGSLLADTTLAEDPFRQDVAGRSLAEGAAGTDIYGDVFAESPGYAFQREEMERQLDRVRSRGGNYGGRAVIEAQRRAQGLAAGDYYNWASGRSRDVDRLSSAEARDAGRLDAAGVNYLGRRAGDVGRLDAAAAQEDRLLAVDQQRGDQAYYNYLANLGAAAGVGGNPTGQAVASSQAAGGAVAGAYGAQGRGLAGIYSGLGTDQANIYGSQYASYNDILQGGVENLVTYGAIT